MADDAPATTTTRVHIDLLEMARVVCAHTKGPGGRQIKLTEYLDAKLREPIVRDYNAVIRRIREEGDGGRKSRKS